MVYRRTHRQFSSTVVVLFLAGLSCFGASTHGSNVLVIHSGSEDWLIYRRASQRLEQVLAADGSLRVQFFHEYLNDLKLPVDSARLAESLRAQYFSGEPPDLVVAVGTLALRLFIQYGTSHFRAVPVVFLIADDHVVPLQQLPPQITGVTFRFDFAGTVALALRLQPDTRQIFFVAGTTGAERYYEDLFKREAGHLLSQYQVIYLDNLTLGALLNRVAGLPKHSVVFYLAMIRDSASTYYVPSSIIGSITAASNAPIYSCFITQIGTGILGGQVFDVDRDAEQAAAMARRILFGEAARNVQVQSGTFQTMVDWRQLKRWHIDERALPPETVVLFREPSAWIKFRPVILGSLAVFSIELALILWLIRESHRRRLSELALKTLSGRLLKTQEEERARIARELHDGVGQQISFLGISLSAIKSQISPAEPLLRSELIKQQALVKELDDEVRRLSHDLHPPILKIFGIDRALRQYCEEFESSHGIQIQFKGDIGSDRLPQESGLCFYRIVQECLRNVAKHANTDSVQVSLVKNERGYVVSIRDKGSGFNPADPRARGLGLLSMQERIEALHGVLTIWSKPNQGTVITAQLPFDAKSPDRDHLGLGELSGGTS